MHMNRREMLGGLALLPAMLGFKNKEPEMIMMKAEVAERPLMDISNLETDFLEPDINDGSFFMEVARRLLLVVVDGKVLKHCVYANCRTGEAHCIKTDAAYHHLATPLMECVMGRKVQILFKSKKHRAYYMERIHLVRLDGQTLPLPLSDGTSNSPVRQMLEARYDKDGKLQ